jgi:hypothetical protein
LGVKTQGIIPGNTNSNRVILKLKLGGYDKFIGTSCADQHTQYKNYLHFTTAKTKATAATTNVTQEGRLSTHASTFSKNFIAELLL